jgi:hypothetical protein
MSHLTIRSILLWAALPVSIVYMLDPLLRFWRNQPGKWGPLYVEFLLPVLYVWLTITNDGNLGLRVLTAAFVCAGLLSRLIARKRFGIPAWPPPGESAEP